MHYIAVVIKKIKIEFLIKRIRIIINSNKNNIYYKTLFIYLFIYLFII